MASEKRTFHLTLPTPFHPLVLLASALLLALRVFTSVDLPWWVILAPMWLSAAAVGLVMGTLQVAVIILNRRNRNQRTRLVVK